MGMPPQLLSWDLDCRHQLQCGREQRSFLLVRGLGGAQVSELSGWMTCDMGWTAVVMLATNVSNYEVSFTALFDKEVVTLPNETGFEHG